MMCWFQSATARGIFALVVMLSATSAIPRYNHRNRAQRNQTRVEIPLHSQNRGGGGVRFHQLPLTEMHLPRNKNRTASIYIENRSDRTIFLSTVVQLRTMYDVQKS